jgi:biotin operon repressor BirA-like protein
MKLAWRLARVLGDGRFHSGETLASEFDVSRTVVWRAIHALESAGLEVHSVTGKGYRLAEPIDWIDADILEAALPVPCRERLAALEVHDETDSTNRCLLDEGPPAPGRMRVSIAEHQTGGRGRCHRAMPNVSGWPRRYCTSPNYSSLTSHQTGWIRPALSKSVTSSSNWPVSRALLFSCQVTFWAK